MKARVQKWGNSLAIRIPAAVAKEAGLGQDAQVDMSLSGGAIVIKPAPERPTLEELIARITPESLHGEWDTGPAVGKEVW